MYIILIGVHMKTLAYLLLVPLLFSHKLYAENPPQGTTIALDSGSSCGNLNLDLGAFGDNITSETVKVTDENNFDLLNNTSFHSAHSHNGVVQKSVAVPSASNKTSGLLGVSYWLNADKESSGRAEYFVVVDCSNNKAAYTCAGKKDACPVQMSEYFPQVKIEYDTSDKNALIFEEYIYGSEDSYGYASLRAINRGRLDLSLTSLSITGEDARFFEIYSTDIEDALKYPITYGNSDYIEIDLKPIKRAGDYSAVVNITTNDPFNPQMSIPIKASVALRQDLSIDTSKIKHQRNGGSMRFTGQIIVKNTGYKTSKAGSRLSLGFYDANSVRTKCDYSNCPYKSIYQSTLLKTTLAKLKPGEKKVIDIGAKSLSVVQHRINKGDYLYAELKVKGAQVDNYNDTSTVYLK
jgi:hypothetical protein